MSDDLYQFIEKTDYMVNIEKGQKDLQEILTVDYDLILYDNLSSLLLAFIQLNNDSAILLAYLIQRNTYLKSIALHDVYINDASIKILFAAIAASKSIHSLELQNINYNDIDIYSRSIARILRHNKTITHLNLKYNNYGYEGVYKITKGLIKNTSIKSLTMLSTGLDNDSAYLISNMLRINKTITHLNINIDNIEDIGIQYISNSLKNLATVKDELDNYNEDMIAWGINSTLISLSIVSTVNTNNTNIIKPTTISSFLTKEHLTKLNISDNAINFDIMNNYLQNNGPSNIKKLTMSNTAIIYYNDYVEYMAKCIQYMPYINNLDISNNNLRFADIKKLSQVLPMTVKKLNISYNRIENSSVVYIAHILQNFNIEKFNMENANTEIISIKQMKDVNDWTRIKNIEDIGKGLLNDIGKVIAQVLSNNTKLKWLNISSNQLNGKIMDGIIDAVKFNTTLEHLDVSANNLLISYQNTNIIDMLHDNKTLKSINMSYNYIKFYEFTNIGKMLLVNNTLHTLNIYSERDGEGYGTARRTYDEDALLYIFTALRKNNTLKSLYIEKPIGYIIKYVDSVFSDISFDNVIDNNFNNFEFHNETRNFMNSVKGINTTLEVYNTVTHNFNSYNYLKPFIERNTKNRILKSSSLVETIYKNISDDDRKYVSSTTKNRIQNKNTK